MLGGFLRIPSNSNIQFLSTREFQAGMRSEIQIVAFVVFQTIFDSIFEIRFVLCEFSYFFEEDVSGNEFHLEKL